jgi:glutaryl-CoA dehydrogenase
MAANERDLLGGIGTLIANHVAKRMTGTEAIHTYDGTETMQALIVRRSNYRHLRFRLNPGHFAMPI